MPSPSTALQWLSLVGLIWLQSVNGTNSNFPSYSSQLKHRLSISQLQLNNLAFASDAGKLFGFISGIAAVYLPLWLVLLIGASLGLIGYGVQYLILAELIPCSSYALIFCLTVLAGNSVCWINTVCYLVAIRNFSLDRQIAVGLTTSYSGLSAKIYNVIVDSSTLFSSPTKRANAYLFLNSTLPLLVCAITSPLVGDINVDKWRKTRSGFTFMLMITMATGVYAVISSLLSIPKLVSMTGMVLFLLAPLLIPLGAKIRQVADEKKQQKVVHDEESFARSERREIEVKELEEVHEIGAWEEIGVKLMVRRVEFWLYFFVYLCGATLGLVFLNNLGQIAESRGCPATSSLVSLSSSFSFFGRVLPSLMDYYFSGSKYMMISRPASIAAPMVPMAISFFLLLNKSEVSLYISTAMIGISTGVITSVAVSMTTELFGTKNFGINHNVVVANIPMGTFVFGYLAAFFYHKEANGGKCIGMGCYKNSFIIWGSLCSFGNLLALILYIRTRKFYSQKSIYINH